MKLLTALAVASLAGCSLGLDNGLARTPPMGWISWAKFYCQIDCVRHPLSCINERLYLDQAERMAQDGYRDAGYDKVNIDDCWMAMQRDPKTQRLVANATRFPHGIPWLAEKVHGMGLKLGIYEDYGTKTCGGYPGSLGHLETDAQTFADWDVDMLKLDGCNVDTERMGKGYPRMEVALNATRRATVYSCSWPAYLTEPAKKVRDRPLPPTSGYPDMARFLNRTGKQILYSCEWPFYVFRVHQTTPKTAAAYGRIAEYCNLWRNYDDISKSWASIAGIIKYYVANQDLLIPVNGPGQWNDPDMIVVGNNEISVDQSEAQMAIWSMWSAPLFMSNDLRWIAPAYRDILLNAKVIAVDQDPLGVMARAVSNSSNVITFVKAMTPTVVMDGATSHSYAIAFLNMNADKSASVTAQLSNLGLNYPNGYSVEDLYKGTSHGVLKPSESLRCSVNPTGVCLLKATLNAKPRTVDVQLL